MDSRTRRWIKRTCAEVGVTEYEVEERKHIKLTLRHAGRQAICIVPRSASDHRSLLNQRATIKREWRRLTDGQG